MGITFLNKTLRTSPPPSSGDSGLKRPPPACPESPSGLLKPTLFSILFIFSQCQKELNTPEVLSTDAATPGKPWRMARLCITTETFTSKVRLSTFVLPFKPLIPGFFSSPGKAISRLRVGLDWIDEICRWDGSSPVPWP